MQVVQKVINLKTGLEFVNPNNNLVQYAKGDSDYKLIYEEVDSKEEEKFTEEGLKCMSVKDLQGICDSLEIECDKRKKDAMIDAILKYGR